MFKPEKGSINTLKFKLIQDKPCRFALADPVFPAYCSELLVKIE
jgi:hypothetical protein